MTRSDGSWTYGKIMDHEAEGNTYSVMTRAVRCRVVLALSLSICAYAGNHLNPRYALICMHRAQSISLSAMTSRTTLLSTHQMVHAPNSDSATLHITQYGGGMLRTTASRLPRAPRRPLCVLAKAMLHRHATCVWNPRVAAGGIATDHRSNGLQ